MIAARMTWVLVVGLLATQLQAQGAWVTKPTETVPDGRFTDYRNPVPDSGRAGVGYFRITVCDNGGIGRWQLYPGTRTSASVRAKGSHAAIQPVKGNQGAVTIRPISDGNSEFDIAMANAHGGNIRMHLRVRVISCRKSGIKGVVETVAKEHG